MATPHRCCYEDHQSCSQADRKRQNNPAILAVFLMWAASTYRRESCIHVDANLRSDGVLYQPLSSYSMCLYMRKRKISKIAHQHRVAAPFTPHAPQSLSFLSSLVIPGEGSYGGCTAEGHALLIAPLNEVIHNVTTPI